MKRLLTGNEAIARGAFEAGVVVASAYPGTPSSEILFNIATYKEIYSEWAPNEKVSLEVIVGASMAGVRTMAAMKHVGLNVAADPLFTFAYTGVNGGAVIIVADEPGQHSSQNEQDSRWYAQSSKLPMLEPANSQECLNMVKEAFEMSEKFDTPVIVRMTTRVCHSKSIVECGNRTEIPVKPYVKDASKYVMVPAFARMRRVVVEKRMDDLKNHAENSSLNFITKGGKPGVIASGVCRHYTREIFGDSVTYLDMGFTHPLPDKILSEFAGMVDEIYVIEENDPYLRTWVKALGFGNKLKDVLPKYGEMTPDVLRRSLGLEVPPEISYDKSPVVPRPPALCAGCPHRGFFFELSKRKDLVVTGDIGCYTLGFAPPFNAMDSCICMGGAFSVGHGFNRAAQKTGNKTRAVGVLGDSTFFHTGINSLIEVVYNGSNTVCVILDNRTTGMTGGQEHPGTGKDIHGNKTPELDITKIVEACGVSLTLTIDPNNLKEINSALDKALAHDGTSVIITKWPCALKKMDENERSKYENPFKRKYEVSEKCTACSLCLRCGCPAIFLDKGVNKATINPVQCLGCGVCEQVCPLKAINAVERSGAND